MTPSWLMPTASSPAAPRALAFGRPLWRRKRYVLRTIYICFRIVYNLSSDYLPPLRSVIREVEVQVIPVGEIFCRAALDNENNLCGNIVCFPILSYSFHKRLQT